MSHTPGYAPRQSSIVREWHALDVGTAIDVLQTTPSGLSTDEAARRLVRCGHNIISTERQPGSLQILISQFRSPLILLLLAASLVMLAIGETLDTMVILLVVLLNSAIGYVQESQAAKSVNELRALLSDTSRVVRDGSEIEIDSTTIVPGDLVLLESGDRVPADIRLASSASLVIDESLLTGESVGVRKRIDAVPVSTPAADQSNMAFAGTTVVRGRGRGYVVGTGDATQLGAMAGEMPEIEQTPTPWQHRLDHLVRAVSVVVATGSVIAFAAGVASGRTPSEMFIVAVALAVSAIPEGLPIAFTITLSVGVRHMARRNAIARRLPVVESLGSTTVIGSDKTGTLTENRMTVQRIWSAGQEVEVPFAGAAAVRRAKPVSSLSGLGPFELTALCGVLTNESTATFNGRDWTLNGDPTETALIIAATAIGIDVPATRKASDLILEIPFEPEHAFSASVRRFDGKDYLFVKGAPERLLAKSVAMRTPEGEGPLDWNAVLHAGRRMAAQGERVIGMAYRLFDSTQDAISAGEVPDSLVFLGLQGLSDPARPGAREAIAECRKAGVRTIMITGDHQATASAIARRIGIGGENVQSLSGAEMESLTPDELATAVKSVDVFARVTPQQKLQIVQGLQRGGEVVAVTGDGVNDAPALRAADIGVAMGKRGTDVAKEAADMILADDNFVSIVAAIEEGRTTSDNVRKVVSFLFSTNAAEVLIVVTALLLNWPLPMIAVQILWLNLVTDSLQVMALAFEPPEPDIMRRPPLGRNAGVLSRELWQRVGLAGVVMTIGTLSLFRWELDHGVSERTAQTLVLTTMVLYQMLHALNSRSATQSLLTMPALGNRLLLGAVAASVAIHAASLYLPPTQYLLRVEPLSLRQWAIALLVSFSIIVSVEVHKWLLRRRTR